MENSQQAEEKEQTVDRGEHKSLEELIKEKHQQKRAEKKDKWEKRPTPSKKHFDSARVSNDSKPIMKRIKFKEPYQINHID